MLSYMIMNLSPLQRNCCSVEIRNHGLITMTDFNYKIVLQNTLSHWGNDQRCSQPRIYCPGLSEWIMEWQQWGNSTIHSISAWMLIVWICAHVLPQGRNPNIVYTLANRSNHTQLFQVTQEGLLIARTDRLYAREKYMLQVRVHSSLSSEVKT